MSTGRYWNGTGFGASVERWLPASGTTSWSFAFPSFPAEGTYKVRVRATDNAGNTSTPVVATFIYDATAPKLALTFPTGASAYTSASWNAGCPTPGVCGTADDGGSGVSQVEVSVRRGTGNYWDGTAFASPTEVFFTANGTTSWSLPFPASNFGQKGNYTVRVRATDGVGNVRGPAATRFSFTP
jgi:predicted phage tail protein